MPSVVAGALLVCLYSLSHFGTPAILGTGVGIYTIPTMIYELIHQSAGASLRYARLRSFPSFSSSPLR